MMDVQDRVFIAQAAPVSRGRQVLLRCLPAVLVPIIAFVLLVRPYLTDGAVLGDIGDARFNIYVLEHTFRYLTGLDSSYQSPDFFYPFPGVLLFSDTHIGSVPFYLLFRSAGLSPFSAFTLWIFAGYVLTFWASYYVFLRFGFDPLSAAVAAVIFAFSLPSLAQLGHAQLTYRAGIPLAFLGLWNFLRRGLVRDACLLVASVAFQLLCSIYLGVFLLLALGVFAVCVICGQDWRRLSKLPSQLVRDACRDMTRSAMYLAGTAAAVAATFLMLYAHQRWGALYGLGRHWPEVSTMVPRPQSYFLMSVLPYWNLIYRTMIGLAVPMAHEHNLFLGVGASCLLAMGIIAAFSADTPPHLRRLSISAVFTLLCLVVCLTKFGDFSLYYYISALPGLSAIRAVSRIGIVLVFPAALVIAAGIHVMLRSRSALPSAVAPFLLVAIVAAEIAMVEKPLFKVAEANLRVDALVSAARERSAGIERPILFVNEGSEPGYKIHLDAMFAAQQLGWPTMNGYSSVGVPGSDYQPNCGSPASQIETYQRWTQTHSLVPVIDIQSFKDRLVMVGWPDCGNARTTTDDRLGPEPSPELARKISLIPVLLDKRQSQVVFEFTVRNEGPERLVVHSFRPVRISWRFVQAGTTVEKGMGWDTRQQLDRDVLPHSSSNVTVSARLPKTPGEYRLQVSLVSEFAYWFHDQGMEILQFEYPVTVQ